MEAMRWVPFVIVGGAIAVWQAGVGLYQIRDRKRKYQAASDYAASVGKPLLVIGGPHGGNPFRQILRLPSYSCGDVCLDLDPEACMGCPHITVADVRDIPYPDKYFGACLASHVIEHLPTLDDALRAVDEMQRVAEAIFIAYPLKQSIIAWLIPGHHLWIRQEGDWLYIEQRGLVNY